MAALLKLLETLVPVLYALAWANYALLFLRDLPISRKTATASLLLALGAHLLLVFGHAFEARRCPMGSFREVLSVLVLAVGAVYLVLEARQKNRYTGVFLLSLILPLSVVAMLLPPAQGPASDLLKSPLFGLHTSLALLGYAALIVSTVYGVMYLLLHRALKRRAFGLVFRRLPSLEGLSDMTVGAAVITFAALTLTILVGILWGHHAAATKQIVLQGSLWSDPKISFTVLVWALYGLGILARYTLRWSNRSVVYLFLAGFVMAVLAVVLLNTWLATFHRFTT